jgi:hypothetical protein
MRIQFSYTGEKERTLGKEYGIRQGAIANTLREHIENLRNIIGNRLET